MNIRLLLAQLLGKLRHEGPRATFRAALGHARNRRESDDFDAIHGTDTGGVEPLWKFKINSPNVRFGRRYQATDEQELRDVVNFLPENPGDFTFIDLGCGKGRTLLGASALGFKAVVGVEFAVELVKIAKSNLEKMGTANAIVAHADATDFQFPHTNFVLYLFNPFSVEVMRKVIDNLRTSLPRQLYIVYKVPECAEVLDSSGFLKRIGSPPTRPYIQIWTGINERGQDDYGGS